MVHGKDYNMTGGATIYNIMNKCTISVYIGEINQIEGHICCTLAVR